MVRVVDRIHVARPHLPAAASEHLLDGLPHRAQMHRNVRGIGDQIAVGVEEGAGEVEPLLDVDGVRGVLQADAHLLGDGHEEAVEDLQHHRVGFGAGRDPVGTRPGPGQQEVAGLARPGLPVGVEDRGRVLFGDDRRAGEDIARAQVGAPVEAGVLPPSGRVHPDRRGGPQLPLPATGSGLVPACATGRAARLDRDRLGHQRLVHGEGVARAVRPDEIGGHGVGVGQRDADGGVGPRIADQHPGPRGDRLVRDPVVEEFAPGLSGERVADLAHPAQRVGVGELRLDGLFAHRGGVGDTDAVRGEHPGQRGDEHRADAQRVGDRAGVLAAGAAEAGEGVAGDVAAALDGDLLDGVGHIEHGDVEVAGRDLFRAAVVPVSAAARAASSAKRARTTSASSGWSPSGPKTAGKWAGWMRPSITWASVTVSGPPRR